MHAQPVVDHRHRIVAHLAGADRVIGGLGGVAAVVEQLLVGGAVGSGSQLVRTIGIHAGMLHDLAGDAHAAQKADSVFFRGQKVRPDRRGLVRIGGPSMYRTERFRAHLIDPYRHAGLGIELGPVVGVAIARGHEEKLHVRSCEFRSGSQKSVAVRRRGGKQPAAGHRVAQYLRHEPEPAGSLVQGDAPGRPPAHAGEEVVAVALAHTGKRVDDVDTE